MTSHEVVFVRFLLEDLSKLFWYALRALIEA